MSQDFSSVPTGAMTAEDPSNPPWIDYYSTNECTTSGYCDDTWRVGTSTYITYYTDESSFSGRFAYIDYGPSGYTQSQSFNPKKFTPATSTVEVSFSWAYKHYGSSYFWVGLYDYTTSDYVGADGTHGSFTSSALLKRSFNDADVFRQNIPVTPGHSYAVEFYYFGDYDYGAKVDNILVTEFRAGCQNVNECADGSNNCSANAICTDFDPVSDSQDRQFTCACKTGYAGNGVSCSQVACPANSTRSGDTCVCNSGYSGSVAWDDGSDSWTGSCTDINECLSGNGRCAHTCTNTAGSRTCSCDSGYFLASNQTSCTDYNECSGQGGGNNCSANANCTNAPGIFLRVQDRLRRRRHHLHQH